VHDLHNRELAACTEFVKENAGEFSFMCKKCRTIVSTGGLPHWAITTQEKGDSVLYHIWSRELFSLVKAKKIPLHYMAFALQTSIEGLLMTAELRGEKVPEFAINEEEEKQNELLLEFEGVEDKRQR
jgi:hypothetical protein